MEETTQKIGCDRDFKDQSAFGMIMWIESERNMTKATELTPNWVTVWPRRNIRLQRTSRWFIGVDSPIHRNKSLPLPSKWQKYMTFKRQKSMHSTNLSKIGDVWCILYSWYIGVCTYQPILAMPATLSLSPQRPKICNKITILLIKINFNLQ